MRIYLCGGMKGTWQDLAIQAAPQHEYLDPRTHGLTDEASYTRWDLAAIDGSDLVLAYMTSDNPSGYGLNLEIGYAAAKRTPIILVLDGLGERDKYFGMARACSRVVSTIDEAIQLVKGM